MGSIFDTYFTLDSERKNEWVFSGATNSRIEWNDEAREWQLTIIENPQLVLSRTPLPQGFEHFHSPLF